jgi:hypothetical protein
MSNWTNKSWATKWWKADKKDKKASASSYWYDDYSSDFDYGSFYKGWDGYDEKEVQRFEKSQDLYKLNSTRRAIANFVNIVTGRNIPVTYMERSMSSTDGERVILSADINDNFDVGVGLALHEGSHIVLSDFKLLEAINRVKTHMAYTDDMEWADKLDRLMKHDDTVKPYTDIVQAIFSKQVYDQVNQTKGLMAYGLTDVNSIVDVVHSITNWIEDRRIDHYIYTNAPGYREYYKKLYDFYFNAKDVTKGIESDEYTDETIDSYLFRIVNFTNEKTDLNKLKALRRIYEMIDVKRINRLKTTAQTMELAIDVIAVIFEQIGNAPFTKQSQQGDGDGDGQSNEVEITDIVDGDSNEQGGSAGQVGNGMSGVLSQTDSSQAGGGKGTPTKITLSKTALEKLKKLIQKQKDFLNGKDKKKSITKDEAKSLSNIEDTDSQLVNVGGDYEHHQYYANSGKAGNGIDCIVVKKMTKQLLESDDFPFKSHYSEYDKEVQEGIRLGMMLGNKLSVRSESRDTVFNRLNKGKIDQRLISGLGYGAESVFYTREVDQYNRANLHISIDYSGSMSGTRIKNAIVCTTAIVKACQMARNINVQVSVRSTSKGNYGRRGGSVLPYIALVYDSRKDSFKWFCEVMTKMTTGNTTPEGLCFEAIMKNFIPSNKDVDSYFLNFSDGEPCFEGGGMHYSGDAAARHTSKRIRQMKENGINILSYFISSQGESGRAWDVFKQCYGDGAKIIDPRNMMQVAKTMNEMFLKKGKRAE